MAEVGSHRVPPCFIHARGQAMLHFGKVHLVHDGSVDPLQLGIVELRRRPTEGRKVEAFEQYLSIGNRLYR